MAQTAYNGLAKIGELKAKVGLVFAVCIALSMCASGASVINSASKDKHKAKVIVKTSGSGSVKYTVGGKTYTYSGSLPSPTPAQVTLAYDPSNPDDAVQNPPDYYTGVGLMLSAILVVICGFVVYKITMSYKPLAAISGAETGINIIKAL